MRATLGEQNGKKEILIQSATLHSRHCKLTVPIP